MLTMIVAVVGYGPRIRNLDGDRDRPLWLKFFGDFILGRHAHPSRPESSLAGRA